MIGNNDHWEDVEEVKSNTTVTIPLYKLKHIKETLRIVANILESSKKESCIDRMIIKSTDYLKDVLK